MKSSIGELRKGQSAAGLLGIIALLTAFWTASGYLGAFMRACNAVYDVEEGRPFWKTVPLRLLLTLGSVVLVSLTLGALVLTGGVADTVGNAIGLGDTVALPADVVHSVANPVAKLTGAIHIYGGDFFAGGRTEWDPETLAPRPWSIQGAVRQFEESNARFFGAGAAACGTGGTA